MAIESFRSFTIFTIIGFLLSFSFTVLGESVFCDETTASDRDCNIIGEWKNDLGSVLKLTKTTTSCQFTGTLRTTVESKEGAAGVDMTGDVTAVQHPKSKVFSMITVWAAGSMTAWSGQCYITPEGKEVLKTTWLLRSETDNKTEWMSTRIGNNVFTRI